MHTLPELSPGPVCKLVRTKCIISGCIFSGQARSRQRKVVGFFPSIRPTKEWFSSAPVPQGCLILKGGPEKKVVEDSSTKVRQGRE